MMMYFPRKVVYYDENVLNGFNKTIEIRHFVLTFDELCDTHVIVMNE